MKPGLLAAEYGRSLNQVEQIRLLADYTGEEVDDERAEWAIKQAESFVDAMKR